MKRRAMRAEEVRKPEKIIPNTNYKDKYAHLIGHEAALDAARKTETNKSYGFGKQQCILCIMGRV